MNNNSRVNLKRAARKLALYVAFVSLSLFVFLVFAKGIRQSEKDRESEMSLYTLLMRSDLERLKARFSQGADPNAHSPRGIPLICEVILHPGLGDSLRVLLDAGADPATRCFGRSCLEVSIIEGNFEGALVILDHIELISDDELSRLNEMTTDLKLREIFELKSKFRSRVN